MGMTDSECSGTPTITGLGKVGAFILQIITTLVWGPIGGLVLSVMSVFSVSGKSLATETRRDGTESMTMPLLIDHTEDEERRKLLSAADSELLWTSATILV